MEKQIQKLKIYLFILGFAFIIQSCFSILFFRQSNFLHSSSFSSIDSLITEIGELKDENLVLYNQVESQDQMNSINLQYLTQLNQTISGQISTDNKAKTDLANYNDFLEREKTRLNSQNIDLSNLLNKKDAELTSLKSEKDLQANIQEADLDNQVFIFLGQNQKLTDSIQLVFVNLKKKTITLISIPRDLYFEGRKINEYLSFYGPDKLKDVLANITGFKIDHYLEIDFTAFTEMIDIIGGLNINVDKEIIDSNYPNGSGGYKTVSFKPGMEIMNGTRALEYARSRKSTSDFDRSLRQQKILVALTENLKNKSTLENINFYLTLYQKIQKNISTDVSIFEALQFFDLYKDYEILAGNILSNENFLYSSRSSKGQSILLPKTGDYSEFQQKLLDMTR